MLTEDVKREMTALVAEAKAMHGDDWKPLVVAAAVIDVADHCLVANDMDGNEITVEVCNSQIQKWFDLRKNFNKVTEWLVRGDVSNPAFVEAFWEWKMVGPEEPLFLLLKEAGKLPSGEPMKDTVQHCVQKRLKVSKEINEQLQAWEKNEEVRCCWHFD